MRRLVMNAALGRSAKARRNPAEALAVWRDLAGRVASAADRAPDRSDLAFADDLGVLLRCLASVPGLTPVGWTLRLRDAAERFENRLRVKWIHAQNHLVGAEPIERPVFIVGLPRTAAALVHRILAAAPGHRGPLRWELQRTGLARDTAGAARSRREVEHDDEALRRLAPAYDAIRPVRTDRPEESSAVMWRTYAPLAFAPLPEYRSWLEQVDQAADYAYLRQVLQVLQYGRERRRWILRFPGHVAHLELIRRVFPGAVFVWTHREPAAALASYCTLVERLTSLHCKEVDPASLGRPWLGVLADSIACGRKARRDLPGDAIADVSSHRLVSDPHRHAPLLFEQIGAKWTTADRNGLNAIADDSARASGQARPLERFGLHPFEIEAAFGDYGRQVAAFRG